MRTELLSKLYDDFGIDQLPHTQHGVTSDRLGKLYEKYILDILLLTFFLRALHLL